MSHAADSNVSTSSIPAHAKAHDERAYIGHWQQLAASFEQIQRLPLASKPRLEQIEAFIGLGLSTLSLRECARLVGGCDDENRLAALKLRASVLANDLILVDERESTLRSNLARIESLLPIDETRIARWRSIMKEISWYRALDGNIVRCNESKGRVAHLMDVQSLHRRTIAPLAAELEAKFLSPIFLEGVDPPWALHSLLQARPPKAYPNFRQRLIVYQADWNEFFDGLACMGLGDEIGNSRILWCIGNDAPAQLLSWYACRPDDVPPTMEIHNPLMRTPTSPDSRSVIKTIDTRWSTEYDFLIRKIQARSPRDRSELVSKYARVTTEPSADVDAGGSHEPLRVLLLSSRYTTYVQHAIQDLADALTHRGCHCHIHIEQDDSQVFSNSVFLRSILEYDPDLVFSINYPRALLNEQCPIDIPHVCWVQDAMDHLLDAKVGRSMGNLDLLVGMTKNELVNHYEYPAGQVHWMPMVASSAKFSAPPLASGFECDIAWVTHQSEHPEIFKARLIESVHKRSAGDARTFESLLGDVHELVTSQPQAFLFTEIHRLVDDAFFSGQATDDQQQFRSSILNTHVIPYADRVFRHQTAAWAARIAQRRGWSFKLFGSGWENHPELAEHAAGSVSHGEALAHCYRSSGVQLHASLNQVTHQRVSECFLSGGFPLCRVARDSFAIMNNMAILNATTANVTVPVRNSNGITTGLLARFDTCPTAQRLVTELHRLQLCGDNEYADKLLSWPSSKIDAALASLAVPVELANAQMFAASTDLYFATESQLEHLIEHSLDHSSWRHDRIVQGTSDLPRDFTFDGFAQSLLELVLQRLRDAD